MTPGQRSTNEDWGELQEMLSTPLIKVGPVCHLPTLDKAPETVINSTMIMACNMERARMDTTLKQASPHLHEHDRNRLRISGFMSQDLFSPSILVAVERS